jgi:Flp pilus assembly protein TadG
VNWLESASTSNRGSATAEFAIVLPAFFIVLAVVMSFLVGTVQAIKCQDAAREAARAFLTLEGPNPETVVRKLLGNNSEVKITTFGSTTHILVSAQLFNLPLNFLPKFIQGEAWVYNN